MRTSGSRRRPCGAAPLPRLVLAGAIPAEAAAIVARVKGSRLAGTVDLLGYVDDARRQDVYRGALAFVMPSHHEGFGMPAVEAMAIGVPVIAADRGALPEAVGRAGLLFDPADPTALAQAMRPRDPATEAAGPNARAGWARAAELQWTDAAAGARRAWAGPSSIGTVVVAERALHIGIDARELAGHPTGVGRYLSGLLHAWATDQAVRHRFTLFSPSKLEGLGELDSRFTQVVVPDSGGGHLVGTGEAPRTGGSDRRRRVVLARIHGAAVRPLPVRRGDPRSCRSSRIRSGSAGVRASGGGGSHARRPGAPTAS